MEGSLKAIEGVLKNALTGAPIYDAPPAQSSPHQHGGTKLRLGARAPKSNLHIRKAKARKTSKQSRKRNWR